MVRSSVHTRRPAAHHAPAANAAHRTTPGMTYRSARRLDAAPPIGLDDGSDMKPPPAALNTQHAVLSTQSSLLPRPRIQIPDLRRVHPRAPAQTRHPREVLHHAPLVHADEHLAPRVG